MFRVEISFDVNENLNVDEEISVENREEIDVDTPDVRFMLCFCRTFGKFVT